MAQDLVSKPEDNVLYMSRRSELRLTHTPRYPILGPGGQKVGEGKGVALGFRDGTARLPKTGEVILKDSLDGGESRMPAEEAHKWLREHRLFGDQEEGFWEVVQPAPPISEEEQERMLTAALGLDSETLQGMADQERAGWGREQIIRQCEEAVSKIQQVHDKAAADAAAAAKPKPKAS